MPNNHGLNGLFALKLRQPACLHGNASDQSFSLSGPKYHAAPEIHVVQLRRGSWWAVRISTCPLLVVAAHGSLLRQLMEDGAVSQLMPKKSAGGSSKGTGCASFV